MSDIGIIDKAGLTFDSVAPSLALMFGPTAAGASSVPVISTYSDTLAITMGCHDSPRVIAFVEGLLAFIEREADSVGA
ncbi:MAG: hypothetical protein JXE06_10720 [Coriobacteriia bacterium]|nr:hypothetical protein [Coriobacteriia bacterium]MBN2822287.1 hypothetical protein [Coriobacteriia bacterium]